MVKFIENQWNSCTTPYSKLRENQLFLIINSLKINEIFVKNWEKISYFYMKIDYKLTKNQWNSSSNSPEFLLKTCPKWYKNLNAVNPLRGHKIGQFLTKWYKNFDAVNISRGLKFHNLYIYFENVGRLSEYGPR